MKDWAASHLYNNRRVGEADLQTTCSYSTLLEHVMWNNLLPHCSSPEELRIQGIVFFCNINLLKPSGNFTYDQVQH
jgi:hypothetical protein